MATTIKGGIEVPVKLKATLENANDIVAQLKKSLQGVNKESGIYGVLSGQIDKLEKEASKLDTMLNRPFKNQSDINKFNTAMEKMTDNIQEVAKKMSGLGYNQLTLFSQEDIEKIEKGKSAIKNAIKEVEDAKKKAVASLKTTGSNIGFDDVISDAGITNMTTYEQAVQKITTAINKAQQAANKAGEELKNLQDIQDNAQAKVDFFQGVENGTNQNFTAPSKKTGKQSFKSGGLEKLKEQMTNFGFSEEDLKAVENLSAEKVKDVFKTFISREKNGLASALKALDVAKTNIDTTTKAKQGYEKKSARGQEALGKLEGAVSTEEFKALQKKVENLQEELKKYKEAAAANSEVTKTSTEQLKKAGEAYTDFAQGVEQASDSLSRMSEQQKTLDQIKSSVSNFLGFYQVLNLVKNAVTNMISTVRELDAVMTQISIVTDMSQSDLWGQMETYSNLANQYGTSIKGVYEVSQLYYQQGLKTAEVMELTEQTLVMAKLSNLDYSTATDYMTVA